MIVLELLFYGAIFAAVAAALVLIFVPFRILLRVPVRWVGLEESESLGGRAGNNLVVLPSRSSSPSAFSYFALQDQGVQVLMLPEGRVGVSMGSVFGELLAHASEEIELRDPFFCGRFDVADLEELIDLLPKDRSINVRVVTSRKAFSTVSVTDWDSELEIRFGKLVERWSTLHRIRIKVEEAFHDRFLRIDDMVIVLSRGINFRRSPSQQVIPYRQYRRLTASEAAEYRVTLESVLVGFSGSAWKRHQTIIPEQERLREVVGS